MEEGAGRTVTVIGVDISTTGKGGYNFCEGPRKKKHSPERSNRVTEEAKPRGNCSSDPSIDFRILRSEITVRTFDESINRRSVA